MTPDKTNSREDLLKRLMKLNEELGKKGYLLKNILKGMEERGEKLENPLREKVKKVAKDSENAFVTARETLKEFSDKCKGEEQEIYNDIVGIVDGFQRSTGKDEVESTYLERAGQFLSGISKDFGEKLRGIGTKFATAVKDLFKGMENLAKSAVKALSKERSVAGQTTKKSHIEAMEKQKASKSILRKDGLERPKKHVTFAEKIEEVRKIEASGKGRKTFQR